MRGAILFLVGGAAAFSPVERYNVAENIAQSQLEAAKDAAPLTPEELRRRLEIEMITPNLRLPGNHGNAGIEQSHYKCSLDPKITPETLPFFRNDIQRMWGSACGRNRGVFVLSPSDGHTYGCGNLPPELGVGENVGSVTDPNTTSTDAVKALQVIIESIYNTSTTKDSAACDFESTSMLTCGREEPWRQAPWFSKLNSPIRAVNIGGLFVLERWITPGLLPWGENGIVDAYTFSGQCEEMGNCGILLDHWANFYSFEDFQKMKEYNLNSIRLPVGWWFFADKAGVDSEVYLVPKEDLYDADHPITNVIRWARDAGLYVIMDLHGAPGSQNGLDNSGRAATDPDNTHWGESWLYSPQNMADTIKTLAAIAEYVNRLDDMFGLDNIIALELLNEPWAFLDLGLVRDFYFTGIAAVRLVRPHMPIFMHDSFRGPMWTTLLKNFPSSNVYMDTHIYHGFNPSDAASDTEEMDRQKQYVHEQMSCGYTSMLRYQTCSALPTFTGEWSLAIDNCMRWLDPKFQDFGQCARLESRLGNSWWTTHIRSFAMRQIAMYERELGWSFWCWKVDDKAKLEPSAPLWSFQMAVEYGFIDTRYNVRACLHPATEDYSLSSPPSPAAPVTSSSSDEAPAPAPAPEVGSSANDTATDLAVREPARATHDSEVDSMGAALVALLGAAALVAASAVGGLAARRRCNGYAGVNAESSGLVGSA